ADVQLLSRAIQFPQHLSREIYVHPLDGLRYPARIREESRDVLSLIGLPRNPFRRSSLFFPASVLHIVPSPSRARQNEIASADITVIPQPWHGRLSRLPLLRTLQPLDNSAHVARRILTRGYHFSIPLPHRAHHGFRAGIPSQPPAHLAGKARVAEIRNHHLDVGRREAGGRDLRCAVEPPRGHARIPPRSRCDLLLLEHHPGQVPRQRLRRHPEGSLHRPGLPRLQTNLWARPPRPQSGPEQK